MPKLILIEPKSPNLHIFSQFRLPRLGVFLLGTIMKQKGWNVRVVIEESEPVDFAEIRTADCVGISTITATAPRAYALADRIRAMDVPVLLGGPHVTFLTDEALEHADYVFRGEAEESLPAFAEAWTSDRNFEGIPGLSYRGKGRIVHNPMDSKPIHLDRLPEPDFGLSKAGLNRIGGKRIIPFQTSRGCPFHCSFCSVTALFGKKYRFRSLESIIQELKRYDDRGNFVFFYDDNFTANRERTKELLERMIEEKFKFKWSTQVRADVADDLDLVRLLKKAGCFTLFIGMESVNPESLKSMKKQQTVEDVARAVLVLRKQRIHVHGMFVYGFDQDQKQTVEETIRFAKRNRLTSTQFLILTPFPGTGFYDQMNRENRIRFQDWSLYDAHHAVFEPKHMNQFELQRAQIESHAKFYSLREIVRRAATFSWVDLSLALYAHRLNRRWLRKNKTFLKVMDLIRPKKDAFVTVDYKQKVTIDSEAVTAA